MRIKERDAKEALDKEIKATQHYKEENQLLKQVETKQTAWLVEKDNEVDKLKNEVNILKKTNNTSLKLKAEHDSKMLELFLENGKLTKNMQDIKYDLENKGSMIQSLKAMIVVDEDNDQVTEVETGEGSVQQHENSEDDPEVTVVSTVNMNKSSTGNKCTACDKSFRANQDFERHMNAKHGQKQCVLCDKIFPNETELVKHHDQCLQKSIQTVACSKCKQTFTNNGLRRHKFQNMLAQIVARSVRLKTKSRNISGKFMRRRGRDLVRSANTGD